MLGLQSASVLLKQEYGVDTKDLYLPNSTFIERYVEGHLQSGAMELGLGATWDNAHYVIVSSVHGEAECAVQFFHATIFKVQMPRLELSKLESSRKNSRIALCIYFLKGL